VQEEDMPVHTGGIRLVTVLPWATVLFFAASVHADYTAVDLFSLNAPPGMDIPSVSTLNAISQQQVVGFWP
jgi:hypothetical protein